MVKIMYKKDVLEYFGNGEKVREFLKIKSAGAVPQWGDIIPEKQALKLDKLTKGKLKYNPELYSNGE